MTNCCSLTLFTRNDIKVGLSHAFSKFSEPPYQVPQCWISCWELVLGYAFCYSVTLWSIVIRLRMKEPVKSSPKTLFPYNTLIKNRFLYFAVAGGGDTDVLLSFPLLLIMLWWVLSLFSSIIYCNTYFAFIILADADDSVVIAAAAASFSILLLIVVTFYVFLLLNMFMNRVLLFLLLLALLLLLFFNLSAITTLQPLLPCVVLTLTVYSIVLVHRFLLVFVIISPDIT